MLEKLAEINERFENLTHELGQPDVTQDQERYPEVESGTFRSAGNC